MRQGNAAARGSSWQPVAAGGSFRQQQGETGPEQRGAKQGGRDTGWSHGVGESELDGRGEVGSTCWAGVIGPRGAKVSHSALSPSPGREKSPPAWLDERFQKRESGCIAAFVFLFLSFGATMSMCWLGTFVPCYRYRPLVRSNPSSDPLPWNC
jgi:hypothetical protein